MFFCYIIMKCNERLKAKDERSTHLTYSELCGGLEHLKILAVTSDLTSGDVRLISGLRSPDEVDETVGSITRLRFV
jgi:hypothetical protein